LGGQTAVSVTDEWHASVPKQGLPGGANLFQRSQDYSDMSPSMPGPSMARHVLSLNVDEPMWVARRLERHRQ